jgi:hypothetical protein
MARGSHMTPLTGPSVPKNAAPESGGWCDS